MAPRMRMRQEGPAEDRGAHRRPWPRGRDAHAGPTADATGALPFGPGTFSCCFRPASNVRVGSGGSSTGASQGRGVARLVEAGMTEALWAPRPLPAPDPAGNTVGRWRPARPADLTASRLQLSAALHDGARPDAAREEAVERLILVFEEL